MTRDTYLEMVDKLEAIAEQVAGVARSIELDKANTLIMAGAVWDIYEVRSNLGDPEEPEDTLPF